MRTAAIIACVACIAVGSGVWLLAVLRMHPVLVIDSPANQAAAVMADASDLIDLNASDALSLTALPGIGPVIAGRILEYRDLVGGFTDAEELSRVSGIGEKTMDSLRGLVYAGPVP